MPKTRRQKVTDRIIKILRHTYNVEIDTIDLYTVGNQSFLSTRKSAEVINTSYHNFSNAYVQPLMDADIHRLISGRNKFYEIDKLLLIMCLSRKKGISVFEVCRELKEKLKKKRRK